MHWEWFIKLFVLSVLINRLGRAVSAAEASNVFGNGNIRTRANSQNNFIALSVLICLETFGSPKVVFIFVSETIVNVGNSIVCNISNYNNNSLQSTSSVKNRINTECLLRYVE